MIAKKFIYSVFILSTIFGICLSNAVLAVDSLPKPTMTDVALSDGGTLQGMVVNNQMNGMPGVPVSLRSQDREVAQTTTAENGQFVVQNLRGGVYNVSTAQSDSSFRLWAPRTAPPVANSRAIVFVQNGSQGNGLKSVLGHPLVLPAIIATAIAVPIAVSTSHHSASP
jgi:hypothetical protein